MASISKSERSWQGIAKRKCEVEGPWEGSGLVCPIALGSESLDYGPQNILSATEVAITETNSVKSLLSTNQLTASEVTTAFCKRAAIIQQLTNCITEPLFTAAIARAKELDRYLAEKGEVVGPLHSLPVSVKDSFDVIGVDSSIGIASLCFKPATTNSPLIDLLLLLGCIIIAKTNVPQTLSSLDSINNVSGRTMNPLNRLCTASGSSGSEGPLVAMRDSIVGWGMDTGSSIRVPAMCNGIFGIKPSNGRFPARGGPLLAPDRISRCGMSAVCGPFARTMEDLELVVRNVVPKAWMWAEDCVVSTWSPDPVMRGSGKNEEFVFGILRGDKDCEPLPLLLKLLDEVNKSLSRYPNTKVIELASPPAWKKCQSVMAKFMAIDGGGVLGDLLDATSEPLVPWMQGKFRRAEPRALCDVAELQARRTLLEREMMQLWLEDDGKGGKNSSVDAIICLVAPHPVPEIERYNSAGYTQSWTLLKYPAGTVLVRTFTETDLDLGQSQGGKVITSWDERNRQLWDEKTVDRRVYLGTPLCVQVVVPRLQDQRLIEAMKIVDAAVHRKDSGESKAKL